MGAVGPLAAVMVGLVGLLCGAELASEQLEQVVAGAPEVEFGVDVCAVVQVAA